MVRPTINEIRSVGTWATVYRWNLQFATFPRVGSWPSSDDLNIRCESADIPKRDGTSTEVTIRGHKVKQPGVYLPVGTLTLTFREDERNTIHSAIQSWREICWESGTGKSNAKEDVEATILLTRLNSMDEPIWMYKCIGCFIETYEVGQLAQEGDTLTPSITLSYDDFTEEAL